MNQYSTSVAEIRELIKKAQIIERLYMELENKFNREIMGADENDKNQLQYYKLVNEYLNKKKEDTDLNKKKFGDIYKYH